MKKGKDFIFSLIERKKRIIRVDLVFFCCEGKEKELKKFLKN